MKWIQVPASLAQSFFANQNLSRITGNHPGPIVKPPSPSLSLTVRSSHEEYRPPPKQGANQYGKGQRKRQEMTKKKKKKKKKKAIELSVTVYFSPHEKPTKAQEGDPTDKWLPQIPRRDYGVWRERRRFDECSDENEVTRSDFYIR